jgi:hypothetical protein
MVETPETAVGAMNENDGELYVLDDNRRPVPATYQQWQEFVGSERAVVARTDIEGVAEVKTYFTGLRPYDSDGRAPALFASLLMIGDDGLECGPYQTWEEAEVAHWEMVTRNQDLLNGKNPKPESNGGNQT